MLFSIISILTSDFHLGHRVLRLIVFNGEVSKIYNGMMKTNGSPKNGGKKRGADEEDDF